MTDRHLHPVDPDDGPDDATHTIEEGWKRVGRAGLVQARQALAERTTEDR